MADRQLCWGGCLNVRDLGGLRTADGGRTRWGAVIRGDHANRLTAAGWSQLHAHGVRTIVDLRDADEREPDTSPRPTGLTTIELPLEDLTDTEFWQEWRPFCCTPLYYRAFLARYPRRLATVFAAIAEAMPGGVMIHCGLGRDRTGLVSLVLLTLLGVSPDEIARDYVQSAGALQPFQAQLGRQGEDDRIAAHLARAGTTAHAEIATVASQLDAMAYLAAGGLRADQLAAIRARLLEDLPAYSAPHEG